MPVTRFEITLRRPLGGGAAFGAAGPYEELKGRSTSPLIRPMKRTPASPTWRSRPGGRTAGSSWGPTYPSSCPRTARGAAGA